MSGKRRSPNGTLHHAWSKRLAQGAVPSRFSGGFHVLFFSFLFNMNHVRNWGEGDTLEFGIYFFKSCFRVSQKPTHTTTC